MKPEAMPAFLVNMERERHMVASERFGEKQTVFHRHPFICDGVPNETRRGLRCDLKLVGKVLNKPWRGGGTKKIFFGTLVGKFAQRNDRVAKDAEVGTGAFTFDGIGGVWLAGIEVGEEGGG